MLICCLFISLSMITMVHTVPWKRLTRTEKLVPLASAISIRIGFIDLAEFCEIKPAVNQVETHVFNQQVKPQEIMKKYGTKVMSWGPFAEGRNKFFL